MMTEDQKQALIARCNYLIGGAPEIDVQLAEFALAALTQPASPALTLPDAKPDHDSEDGNDIDYLEPSQVYALGVDDGFTRCLREVEKLNAPHTAPIEPICATGGAEWVNVSDKMPVIGSTVIAHINHPIHSSTNYAISTYDKYGFSHAKVTHWMPLPAAPEEK